MNMATVTDIGPYRSLLELERKMHMQKVLMKKGQVWSHNCKERGLTTTAKGKHCDWCGESEK